MERRIFLSAVVLLLCCQWSTASSTFNGATDQQTTAYGNYAVITGGKFVNGQTTNGEIGSGGVMRYIYEDTDNWFYNSNRAPQQWHHDGWFADTAGVALTMRYQGVSVYDNNGISDASYPTNFYGDPASPSTVTHGLYCGFSMSNNNDWIYAGRFELTETTVIDQITGYFAQTYRGEFAFASPDVRYNANIFSSVPGSGLWAGLDMPANTGGFNGDVFASDDVAGTFAAVADSGEVRHYASFSDSDDIIYALTYTLDEPLTLEPDTYFFNHNAEIVPEPLTMLGVFAGLTGLGGYIRKRRLA